MNKMYEYLKNHAYISYNKKSTYEFELSEERAECIANKYDNLTKELQQENKQLKEAIDKIDNCINNYDVFKVFSFPLMKRWEEQQVKSSIDYEFKTSLIKDLKDILKEVSK